MDLTEKKPTRSAALAGIFLDSAKLLSQTNILPHPKVEGTKDNETIAYYYNNTGIISCVCVSTKSIIFLPYKILASSIRFDQAFVQFGSPIREEKSHLILPHMSEVSRLKVRKKGAFFFAYTLSYDLSRGIHYQR